MIYVQIALILVSIYMAIKNKPKTATPAPALFEEFDFPQVEEGTPQCVFFGDCWTGDWTVLAVGDYRTKAIYTKSGK